MGKENIENLSKINEEIEEYFASLSNGDEYPDPEYIVEEKESKISFIFYIFLLVAISLLVISQVLVIVLKLTKVITH